MAASSPTHTADQLRQFYDELPYPNAPYSLSPSEAEGGYGEAFKVSLMVAQYARTRQIVETEGAVLLNAGCGSGWETLLLAEANPGAKIIGVDLSPTSVKIAEQRLRYHGYLNTEFYALDLLDLEQLGIQFDFISCNDVIYLLDSPLAALQVFGKILKPDGILRTNLHNLYTRREKLEMQEAFGLLGQYQISRFEAAGNVKLFMESLIPDNPRRKAWDPAFYRDNTIIMNNYLLEHDKGFSIPETFNLLRQAGLDMVSLVDAPSWQIESLFNQVPEFVQQSLANLSLADQLHLYELTAPNHRLIDFWAEQRGSSFILPWADDDWLNGSVQLNPVLIQNKPFHQRFKEAVEKKLDFTINWGYSNRGVLTIPADKLPWLHLLLNGSIPVQTLIEKAAQLNSLALPEATDQVLAYLSALEEFLFVLLEPSL
ncbi:MAG: methyltransferase domain-containing protein [Cyanobacteriota bacterium]|nr:methyltransferase domain-containing protein [Cyanobacteriota bacterium]